MEDITKKCAGLRLSEREGSEVDLCLPEKGAGWVLAGKFCTKRRVNLESVARVLKTVWKTEKNFEVSDVGENKALFLFQKEEDMDRVLMLSPWSFDKYLLVLHKLGVGEAVNQLKFNEAAFWVQIHGLPTMSQTKDVGLRIGESLGRVEKVDVDDKGFCLGNFLRIRVSIDISTQLCRGRLVRMGGLSLTWVDFRYERLPIFCYWCGLVDHDERDCMQWMRSKESPGAEDKQFGPWLRAIPERVQRPQLVIASKKEGRQEYKDGNEVESTSKGLVDNPGRVVTADVLHSPHGFDGVAPGRAKVYTSEGPERYGELNIPRNPQGPEFEEQLKEIDDAIFGDGLKQETSTKRAAGEKEAMMGLHQLESTNVSQTVDMANSIGLSLRPRCTKDDIFTMGLSSQKSKGDIKTRKSKMSAQKKAKPSDNLVDKENKKVDVGNSIQEEDNEMDIVEGFDTEEVGRKRRIRTPLQEIPDNGVTGKKIKVEGEVLTLSKLLAQQLGAAAAVGQPRREP